MKVIRLKDDRKVFVRRFTEGDKDSVAEMMASLSEEAVRWGMPPYTRERLERGWWSRMENVTALVALDGDRVAGYAGLRKFSHPRRRGSSDYLIYLHQDYHNVGLGTAMTRHIVKLAEQEGLHRIGLSVVADNEIAIRVYEKVGFEVEGVLRDAYFGEDGRYHDEVHMGLILS
jgi:RimJ/RimL family protein N-acetyltransferase